jgi:spermidine synthase
MIPTNNRVKSKSAVVPAPAPAREASPSPALSVALRKYLYFTSAVTGAAILIIEILGAKMLSPYLGTSHFVWTAQIAITLVALACGYYAGGWLVDRGWPVGKLYGAICAAAVYLIGVVAIAEPVAYVCLRQSLPVGSLLASLLLFFVPLSLLAMVGPFFVRVLTVSVAGVGGNVGRLTSLSTLGSFAGTVLIGYVLIPYLPNSVTMYLTAGALLATAAVYFFLWGRTARPRVMMAIVFLLAMGGGYAALARQQFVHENLAEVFRANSNFGLLQVLDAKSRPRRYYVNDYLTQNTYDLEAKQSVSMFTYMLHGLARAYTPRLERALCIGMGVGIVPMQLAREGVQVDVVEINPAVIPVAQRFFDLEPDRLHIIPGDGRPYLNQCRTQYDAVVLDAFLGDSCPSHLMTREAFAAIRRVLKPEGTLVINTFADLDFMRDFFAASLFKTLASVFPSVRIHNGGSGNTLFVASARPELAMAHEPDFSGVHLACSNEVVAAFSGLRETDPQHGRVLTDDFNPVEVRDAPNRERIRRYLALGMKGE